MPDSTSLRRSQGSTTDFQQHGESAGDPQRHSASPTSSPTMKRKRLVVWSVFFIIVPYVKLMKKIKVNNPCCTTFRTNTIMLVHFNIGITSVNQHFTVTLLSGAGKVHLGQRSSTPHWRRAAARSQARPWRWSVATLSHSAAFPSSGACATLTTNAYGWTRTLNW